MALKGCLAPDQMALVITGALCKLLSRSNDWDRVVHSGQAKTQCHQVRTDCHRPKHATSPMVFWFTNMYSREGKKLNFLGKVLRSQMLIVIRAGRQVTVIAANTC